MPFLKVQTNANIEDAAEKEFLADATRILSSHLGKPADYIMILVEPDLNMVFAGSDKKCAFVELRSLGLTEDKGKPLSKAICDLIEQHLHVAPDRTYIAMSDHPRALWGYNGTTF